MSMSSWTIKIAGTKCVEIIGKDSSQLCLELHGNIMHVADHRVLLKVSYTI